MLPLRLPPIIHPLVQRLLETHRPCIEQLLNGCGSPLHIVLPQIFKENALSFSAALRDHTVRGRVLFAKKANKARCFAAQCAPLDLGVDAASCGEVTQALGAGIPGEHIGVSGPAKTPELLRLALHQRCLVAIDDLQELQQFMSLAREGALRGRALLRIRPETQCSSRFGLNEAERNEALRECAQGRRHIHLEGFSFHLAGYSPAQRAHMAHELVSLCVETRSMGFACSTINIGGGFGVRYVEEPHWDAFLLAQSSEHYHANKRFDSFYPYHCASSGATMLGEILSARASTADPAQSLASRCRAHDIQLLIEPGRALLDQAGFTAFRIQGLKDRESESGYGIVTVDGMSFSLSEQWFNSEFLPDPVLLAASRAEPAPRGYAACIGGSSCLESDMLSWRKIHFPHKPRVNDFVVYINTAGYQMDSNESGFHDRPLPHKVALTITDDIPQWRLDGAVADFV